MNSNVFSSSKKTKVVAYAVLFLYAAIVVYPLLFLFFTSFKSNKEFFVNLFGIPSVWEWQNYFTAWEVGKLGQYFSNSVIVTGTTVLVTAIVSLMGGYALAKLRIPKSNTIMSAFMVFNFIPGIAIYISLYTMLQDLKLSGNLLSLILPYIAWSIPLAMYIIKQYFETIPQELIESGRIDGCNEFQNFFHIMLPLVTPALATIVVFTFINNWGELLWANITTASSTTIKTLPVGLLNFRTEMGVQWGPYTAGICLVTIPLMVVFACFQKYFVAGLTNGAVKG